jgi:hypothetical protein
MTKYSKKENKSTCTAATADQPKGHSDSVQLSLSSVTGVLTAAATVLFITCAAKLTFTALWAQDFMCFSVILGSR